MVIGIKVDQRLSTTGSPNLGSVINSLNWKERLTKLNKFVCLFVSLGQKNIAGKDTNRDTFSMLLEVGRCREFGIWGLFTSKPHNSTGNRWKSRSTKTSFTEVSRCGKHESSTQTCRKPIGRPGTNRNRVRWKTFSYSSLKEQLTSRVHFSHRSWSRESRYKCKHD